MNLLNKVGIMGGTFNPIHFGHLLLAETAFHQFNLDEILIMPTKNPYYKKISNSVTEEDRVAMVELAIEDNVHFQLSKEELNIEGTTYTVETLSHLRVKHPGYEYYFIMGADSLFHIETWKDPEIIFSLSTLVCAVRDEYDHDDLEKKRIELGEKGADIVLLNMPEINISSSDIRKRVGQKLPISSLVPDDVAKYIRQEHLYEGN